MSIPSSPSTHPGLSAFLEALSPDVREALVLGVGAGDWFDGLWQEAREHWRTFEVPQDAFGAYLAHSFQKQTQAPHPLDALNHLCINDLYLACGCVMGQSQAVVALEQAMYWPFLALRRQFRLEEHRFEELKQALWVDLLVREEGKRTKLETYTGQSRIEHWMRIVLMRRILRSQTKSKREVPMEEEVLARMLPTPSPIEKGYIKSQYQEPFREALREALGSLNSKERNLLRYSYVRGLSIDRIAAIYRVHRSTAARWLQSIRSLLYERVQLTLADQFALQSEEFESILVAVKSQLELSFSQVIQPH